MEASIRGHHRFISRRSGRADGAGETPTILRRIVDPSGRLNVSVFDSAIRRIEQYRICLERDAELGVIPSTSREAVDRCYRTLETVLRSARIEIEGVGDAADAERDFGAHFVGGCSMLALRMFRRMYSETDPVRLAAAASSIRSEGRALMEHLWARLETMAA